MFGDDPDPMETAGSGSEKFRMRTRGVCGMCREGLSGRGQVCGWTENGQRRQTIRRHATETRREAATTNGYEFL